MIKEESERERWAIKNTNQASEVSFITQHEEPPPPLDELRFKVLDYVKVRIKLFQIL